MKQRHNLPMLRLSQPAPRYTSNGIGTGVARQVRYKEEGTPYTLAGATLGQTLRRVTMGLNLGKDTFTSNEKIAHMQDQDMRHGFLKPAGNIAGELSPSTYADWHDAILRRARTAVAAITGASITIAVSGSEYTITRAAGSFLTDGIKKGMVIRLTAGAFNASNLNKNFVCRLVTATVLTGKPLNGSAMVAEGPIATATVTIPGKYSYVPATGHTDKTFTIEDYFPNLAVVKSEQYYGCKMNSMKVTVPSSGIATIDWDILGYNMARSSGAAYFTSPAAETTTGLVAASTGLMYVGDVAQTILTNIDFTVAGNASSSPVVGSNVAPAVFVDKVQAMGQFSCYFADTTVRDAFIDETETGLVVVLAVSNDAACDFVSYMMPRVKLNGAGKDDPNTGISQNVPFKALYNSAGGAGTATEKTTIAYQDSAAP
jgi:hypothetical protein